MVDMKTGFLQAKAQVKTWFRKPRMPPGFESPLLDSLFSADGLALGLKEVYGTRNAGAGLDVHIRNVHTMVGYRELRLVKQVYMRFRLNGKTYAETAALPVSERVQYSLEDWVPDNWLFAYVDDCQAGPASEGGTRGKDAFKEITDTGLIQYKAPPADLTLFMGIYTHCTKAGIHYNQHALAAKCDQTRFKPIKGAKKWPNKQPDTHMRRLIDASSPCTPAEHEAYRTIYGSLAYLQKTRLDVLCILTILGQYSHAPRKYAFTLLRQFAHYVRLTAYQGLFFPAANAKTSLSNDRSIWANGTVDSPLDSVFRANSEPRNAKFRFDLICDASFGEKSNTGWIVLLNDNPIAAKAHVQRRVANSSTATEAQALYDGADQLCALMAVARELGCLDQSADVWTDSANLLKQVHKKNPAPAEQATLTAVRITQPLLAGASVSCAPINVDDDSDASMPAKVYTSATGPNVGKWCNATAEDRAADTERLLYQRAGATKRTLRSEAEANGVLSPDDARELSYLKGAQNFLVDVGARLHHISDKCNPADPLTKLQDPIKLAVFMHHYEDFIKASQELDPTVISRAGVAEPETPDPADGSDDDVEADNYGVFFATPSTASPTATTDIAHVSLPHFGVDFDTPTASPSVPPTFADRVAAFFKFTHSQRSVSSIFSSPPRSVDMVATDELLDALV
jgi:hypothetical protein